MYDGALSPYLLEGCGPLVSIAGPAQGAERRRPNLGVAKPSPQTGRTAALRVAGVQYCPNQQCREILVAGMCQCFRCLRPLVSTQVPVLYHLLVDMFPSGFPLAYQEQVATLLCGRLFSSYRGLDSGLNFGTLCSARVESPRLVEQLQRLRSWLLHTPQGVARQRAVPLAAPSGPSGAVGAAGSGGSGGVTVCQGGVYGPRWRGRP